MIPCLVIIIDNVVHRLKWRKNPLCKVKGMDKEEVGDKLSAIGPTSVTVKS
jgi:hypothetical protein